MYKRQVYRALIDYTRHRTFDVLDVARYNDSVANALTALQSTVPVSYTHLDVYKRQTSSCEVGRLLSGKSPMISP